MGLKSERFKRGSLIIVGLLFVAIGLRYILAGHAATSAVSLEPESGTITAPAATVTDSQASKGKAIKFGPAVQANCAVTDELVNPCRPWLGAWANKYTQAGSGMKSQILYHEQRIGRQVDVVKDFKTPGQTLSADDKYFVNRGTILEANWQPTTTKWSDAAGGNATVNAQIDAMADSIKSVAPHKIMLSVAHEAEHDLSSDANCPGKSFSGTRGTPADYRAMWANVRKRFDAKGVNNVVWAMIYQGGSNWFCVDKDIWPGNKLVDWVMWDPYNFGSNTITWNTKVGTFYNWLSANSDTAHDFNSKPWGLGEWGMSRGVTQAATYVYYDQAKTAVEHNTFPKLKLYIVFDSIGANYQGTLDDIRTLYDAKGLLDQTEQNHYNAFANSPAFHQP